ncbi:MAG: class II aldolase/adducin family protein [Cyanosarcina radialis HA8281-LM2]|jgi:ribulose-5-phosphate 4-epimerase/fuculose-1-phosphate aldolase|nr:class II aldolase/adducin family protein [Cyanosarcina radialis HA8281-LM2]
MNYSLAFTNRFVVVYIFPPQNAFQQSCIVSFLSYLNHFCHYIIIDDIERFINFDRQNYISIFMVCSLDNFKCLQKLGRLNFSLNIVAYFLASEEFQQVNCKDFRVPIKALGFKMIYPDRYQQGIFYPNNQKILDTIYYKTTRNKYKNIKVGEQIPAGDRVYLKEKLAEIKKIGSYFQEMKLNDTDPVAGAIAMRLGDGILINASSTDKYNITEDRICYVEKYLPKTNEIYWTGTHIPSSETAVAFLVFAEFPAANILLHFHDKRMTYAQQLAPYRTSKYVTYGTPGEARTIVRKLKETGNFAIACGHGEFAIASNLAEAQANINKIVALIS